ncbi:HAD-IA family hydrolase [Chromobacterium amazonense]|uniref:HAD-IA family hydrolase n=1 Tax=Chromobacterium amazonense TaxID=1382803 RepID=UPI00237E8DAE|nr:HAD-IA family hydrolase [Chromobacterium amazonense]MDE1715458.1 HAD-IA family hydrolase [Chromobacterium amazonense]
MIEAVFFDFDGVLTTDKYGSDTTNRYLGEATGLGFAKLDQALERHNEALLLGRLSHDDIWPEVCRELGREVDCRLLDAAFRSTPMNQAVLDMARQLHGCYRLGIITDNKRDRMDCLRALHGLDALFDPVVVSAEIGLVKTDGGMFEHALRLIGLGAAQCLFIDNSRRNLETAAAWGMATLSHDDERNDSQALRGALTRRLGICLKC